MRDRGERETAVTLNGRKPGDEAGYGFASEEILDDHEIERIALQRRVPQPVEIENHATSCRLDDPPALRLRPRAPSALLNRLRRPRAAPQ